MYELVEVMKERLSDLADTVHVVGFGHLGDGEPLLCSLDPPIRSFGALLVWFLCGDWIGCLLACSRCQRVSGVDPCKMASRGRSQNR